ncbi:MAG TPA: hypothetical protein VIL20_08895 [Sandaracinaceae bacterium]
MSRWLLLAAVLLAGCALSHGTGTTATDGDGIPDASDVCPEVPESFDGESDGDGCPDGADTYDRCIETADCADPEDVCEELTVPALRTSGRRCTHPCASDADCEPNFGFPGACYDVEGSGLLCYQTCELDADCYANNFCVEINDAGVIQFLCFPDG